MIRKKTSKIILITRARILYIVLYALEFIADQARNPSYTMVSLKI